MRTKILLVEDDLHLGMLLQDYLEMEGYHVTRAHDGQEGWQIFQQEKFHIGIFDVMMPKKDGFTLAKEVRAVDKNLPIIFLTAKNMKADKHEGFAIGGDDYLTKPFDEQELVYRIEAILRRSSSQSTTSEALSAIGAFTFDYTRQLLIHQGEERRLTARENEILYLLCQNKNNILRREDALVAIWGENDYFHGRSFDVFITKLRKYLKPDPRIKIENIHGVGFMLKTDDA
ncbi:MAG: response regulator transcription factor [Bernardetiaceae bacterium]